MPTFVGTNNSETINGTADADNIFGLGGDDILNGLGGDDVVDGGDGNDTIFGEAGNDTVLLDLSATGSDLINLGDGSDLVFTSGSTGQIRLTFTSSEVGNGNANDTVAGGANVRLQGEDGTGALTGLQSRIDDEGITFVAASGQTFDVRDTGGAQRGDQFQVVVLGTMTGDNQTALQPDRSYYFNAGMGDDFVTGGNVADFLVGGAGNDTLDGGNGADTFIGGGGNDQILGGEGNDTAIFNITNDGADIVNLGNGSDLISLAGSAGQIRLTFLSAGVGNGDPNDGALGLNVRMQAEDGADGLTGAQSRTDDEGITFVAAAGQTFDVRDTGGAQRGDQFEVVTLGTSGADTQTAVQPSRSYYFNAGMGDDNITGGTANDFLVGGAGNDTLTGGLDNDTFLGGGGNDGILGEDGNDTAQLDVATGGSDTIDLGVGNDILQTLGPAGQIRLTFTSAEVGNGNPNDTVAGGLNVRLQAEDGADNLTGPLSRVDDEGIVFVAAAGQTFDVRDTGGAQRGDQFEVVVLGTSGADTQTAVQASRPYYFNAGMGDDSVTGGIANDFLVGGAGNDTLAGGAGTDTYIGGGGNDTFYVESGEIVTEAAGGGNDRVAALTSYVLTAGASVELLEAVNSTDTTAINLTGNALNQTIVGNAGSNTLSAGGGNDVLFGLAGDDFFYSSFASASDFRGGTGNDTFYVLDSSDSAFEASGEGSDRVAAAVSYTLGAGSEIEILEAVTLSATTALNLTGNGSVQTVIGNAGANTINGGGGNDVLFGLGGTDTFAFTTALGSGNVDTIRDFSATDDTIALDDAVFAGLSAGALNPNAFATGSSATDADDRIIYNQATGQLFFDADGSGNASAAVLFATLSGAPIISASDFTVI